MLEPRLSAKSISRQHQGVLTAAFLSKVLLLNINTAPISDVSHDLDVQVVAAFAAAFFVLFSNTANILGQ